MFVVPGRVLPMQWAALLSVTFATLVCIRILDPGWRIGFFVNPLREFPLGVAFAILLIGSCDLVLMLVPPVRHTPHDGLPWLELAPLFPPPALPPKLPVPGSLFPKLPAGDR